MPRGHARSGSRAWRQEQSQDPYFRRAKAEGYRARSAYKLLGLHEKFKLLRPGQAVVDLGAAPGSWAQVASAVVGPGGRVIAVDLSELEPLPGVEVIQGDICAPETAVQVRERLGREADWVLCDVAPRTSGIKIADHLRQIALAECALQLARAVLRPGGGFVTKVFQGGDFDAFVAETKRLFGKVQVSAPPATRQESRETFVVATDYRGATRREPATAPPAEGPA